MTVKSKFGGNNSIKYIHRFRHRYEIEIPENLVKGKLKPAWLTYTHRRKGF